MKLLTLMLLAVAFSISEGLGAGERRDAVNPWPTIKPFEKTFAFKSVDKMHLRFSIYDIEGKAAYIVECTSPFAKSEAVRNYAYSRDFECRVAIPGAVLLPWIQLLAVNPNIDKEWESRGGFLWSELTAPCNSHPDWGPVRLYRFRHMLITIALFHANMTPVARTSSHDPYFKLTSLDVRISGKVDSHANRSIGGYSSYPEPRPISSTERYGYMDCRVASK